MKRSKLICNIIEPILFGFGAFCFGMFALTFITTFEVKARTSVNKGQHKQELTVKAATVAILPTQKTKRYDARDKKK